MIDAYQLLLAKESDLVRVRKEVESLRIVATLLSETDETGALQRDGERKTVAELDASDSNENTKDNEPAPDPAALALQLKKQNGGDSSSKASMFRNWLGGSVGKKIQTLWLTTSSDDSCCVGVNK